MLRFCLDSMTSPRASGHEGSDWSELLQRGADPDNPIQEHVFHVCRTAEDDVDSSQKVELAKVVVKVRVGQAEEKFYETGQVRSIPRLQPCAVNCGDAMNQPVCQVLWPAAPLLSYFLLSSCGQRLLSQSSVR